MTIFLAITATFCALNVLRNILALAMGCPPQQFTRRHHLLGVAFGCVHALWAVLLLVWGG